jgi:hypothetical protein
MKIKQFSLLVVAASLLCWSQRAFAGTPVTFEVLATYDYPGAFTSTWTFGINDSGAAAGQFTYQNLVERRGFVRFLNGHFSGAIQEPNDSGNITVATDINRNSDLSGYYLGSDFHSHGFLFLSGTFTEFSIAGAQDTYIHGLNDAGDFSGYSNDASGTVTGFVSIAGSVTSFRVNDASTFVYDMNNLGQCVGNYQDGPRTVGFRREADGTVSDSIAVPGARLTVLYGTNDRDSMVGYAGDNSQVHAVFMQGSGKFALYDYPGARSTEFTGINNQGIICGNYYDSAVIAHGFLVRVR